MANHSSWKQIFIAAMAALVLPGSAHAAVRRIGPDGKIIENKIPHLVTPDFVAQRSKFSLTREEFEKRLGFHARLMPDAKNRTYLLTLGNAYDDALALPVFIEQLGVSILFPEATGAHYNSMLEKPGNTPRYIRNYGIEIGRDVLWREDMYWIPRDFGQNNAEYLVKGGDGGHALFDGHSQTLFLDQNDTALIPHTAHDEPICNACLVQLTKHNENIAANVVFNPAPEEVPPNKVISRIDGPTTISTKIDAKVWQKNARMLYEHGVRQIAVLHKTTGDFYDLDLKLQPLPDGTMVVDRSSFSDSELKVIDRATVKEPLYFDKPAFNAQLNFVAMPVTDDKNRQIVLFTEIDQGLKERVEAKGFKVLTLEDIGTIMGAKLYATTLGQSGYGADAGLHCVTLPITRPNKPSPQFIPASPTHRAHIR